MNRIPYAIASLGLALVACRGGDDGPSGDDTPMIDAPMVATEVTIQEVQNDAMPSGTAIELKGVVVTAIDVFGGRTGDFFVSEPGGGPNSGVKVFGARADQVASIAVGDLVDITGAIKHEACNAAAPCGTIVFDNNASITEVMGVASGSLVVTKTGTGTVPVPAEVDAAAISLLATPELRDAEWEKWEGVLIKVTKARQLGAISAFGGADSEPDENEFRATGFVRVQSALTALPATSTAGTCYDSIVGVGDFFFNYILAPRSAADLVGGGTACRPAATTITAIQTGTNVEYASLTDVYVSAVSFNRKNLWVSTSLAAAPNEGIAVFRGTGMTLSELDANIVPGAKVTIAGVAAEANNDAMGDTVTQITSPVVTFVAAPTTQVVPVAGQSVASLMTAGTGEPYESALVTLTNVKVVTIGTSTNFNVSDLSQKSGVTVTAFKADDDIYRMVTADMGDCFATITGIWSYSIFDNTYLFLPRALPGSSPATPDGVLAANANACN